MQKCIYNDQIYNVNDINLSMVLMHTHKKKKNHKKISLMIMHKLNELCSNVVNLK